MQAPVAEIIVSSLLNFKDMVGKKSLQLIRVIFSLIALATTSQILKAAQVERDTVYATITDMRWLLSEAIGQPGNNQATLLGFVEGQEKESLTVPRTVS
ncbi:MAG: hypothetical protein NC111_06700 [Bacteroides sp.]|nr:hypothetical protein [Bacteroides sp.]MCM1413787.1 hypothetical protein [Bacteroides sp.]MCM1472194.1 hypothetical protein [Bacteroides sp.]